MAVVLRIRPDTWGETRLRVLVRFPPLRRAARYVRARIRRERVERLEGPPAGLAFATLDALCREHGRGGLKRCAHVHLSGWKPRGTYRLELDTNAGPSWRLIFKDECYRPELIAALEGLPACPGPPEAILYRSQNTVLSAFLPQLFWFREVEPGRHFQYLLEDLAPTHALLRPETVDHIKATRGLLHLHKALKEAFAGRYPDGLIRYDRRYSERLLDYALGNLAEYAGRTAEGAVAGLSGRWREVASVHQRDEFYDHDLPVPIHGDYNFSNIHAHREQANQLKVVDWEWAGVGLPHADLAALVKSVRREDQPRLLQVFLEEDRRLDPEQHRRLFHWCQLERRLLDAAFLARQQLASARRVSWLQAEIRRAASDVLTAVEWLDAATHARRAS
jgi:Phosphotransferase enzyme family